MKNLVEIIKEAYETSTHSNNRFAEAISNIKWDSEFSADGEHYFEKGGILFITRSLDPFATSDIRPQFIFGDGSFAEI